MSDPKPMGLGELFTYYATHYPNGTGTKEISRGAIEKRTNIPRATLSRWMRDEVDGAVMFIVKCVALCDVLGCTMDEIVDAALVSAERKAKKR